MLKYFNIYLYIKKKSIMFISKVIEQKASHKGII